MGVVSLRLTDIFQATSQLSAWRPLLSGVGHGRARISLLFKPIKIYLPPTLRGWNIGTLLVDRISFYQLPNGFHGSISIKLSGDRSSIQTESSSSNEDGQGDG